jgi:hypothetical protein
MNDPVAHKNATRVLAAHRIEDIKIRGVGAFVACVCGWINRLEGNSEPEHVEKAWNEHKREHGVRSH